MRFDCRGGSARPPLSQVDLQKGKQWVINYYTALDTHDHRFASNFFIKQGVLSFGNSRTTGVSTIQEVMDWQRNATKQIDHCIRAIYVFHEQILVQTTVTYTFWRGETHQMDCMTSFDKLPSHRKAKRAYIYADFTPLFEKFTKNAGPRPSA
ncbi:hypothetical protein FA15DRAFT_644849 [Coprinopsis marcescibilis]|uniref:SnoaL-like domain-containing protein n=1 Tax=Coprinopsis marcescibilis TaxID=230819 RepID=A0A5C3KNW9_COPMA|nr:hypothetical protein FA15DRAFT_644849 [Coprinopsis marcescibilis]